MNDYYETLKVSKSASTEIISAAYKALMKQYHPDVVPEYLKPEAEKITKQINEAYRILSDPQRRAQYDATLRDKARERGSSGQRADGRDSSNGSERSSSDGCDRTTGQQAETPERGADRASVVSGPSKAPVGETGIFFGLVAAAVILVILASSGQTSQPPASTPPAIVQSQIPPLQGEVKCTSAHHEYDVIGSLKVWAAFKNESNYQVYFESVRFEGFDSKGILVYSKVMDPPGLLQPGETGMAKLTDYDPPKNVKSGRVSWNPKYLPPR